VAKLSTSSLDACSVPTCRSVSSSSPMRPMAKPICGGIEAVMLISEIR